MEGRVWKGVGLEGELHVPRSRVGVESSRNWDLMEAAQSAAGLLFKPLLIQGSFDQNAQVAGDMEGRASSHQGRL